MEECYKCGISGNNTKIYSAISNKGIVKICGDCNSLEKLPIIKKPTEEQIEESKRLRHVSVSERLRNMNTPKIAGREVNLRSLIDKKFQSNIVKTPSDLIPNFHWTIQRIRRTRKISREEFAKGIGESESTVRMIEQGILPEENYKIINKIENFLKISLRKETPSITLKPEKKFILDNSILEKDVKLDSKQIKENNSVEIWQEEYSQDDEKFLDKEEYFEEDKQ